jgi:hypothetical protein
MRGDFDLGWWAPNLVLLLGPWPFARALWSSTAHSDSRGLAPLQAEHVRGDANRA